MDFQNNNTPKLNLSIESSTYKMLERRGRQNRLPRPILPLEFLNNDNIALHPSHTQQVSSTSVYV